MLHFENKGRIIRILFPLAVKDHAMTNINKHPYLDEILSDEDLEAIIAARAQRKAQTQPVVATPIIDSHEATTAPKKPMGRLLKTILFIVCGVLLSYLLMAMGAEIVGLITLYASPVFSVIFWMDFSKDAEEYNSPQQDEDENYSYYEECLKADVRGVVRPSYGERIY